VVEILVDKTKMIQIKRKVKERHPQHSDTPHDVQRRQSSH
jgi:hypothetical protein